MGCGCSKRVILEDFDVKKWAVKTGSLSRQVAMSSEINYITNSSVARNMLCHRRWPFWQVQLYILAGVDGVYYVY